MKKTLASSVPCAGLLTALALNLFVPTTARGQWWADDSHHVDWERRDHMVNLLLFCTLY